MNEWAKEQMSEETKELGYSDMSMYSFHSTIFSLLPYDHLGFSANQNVPKYN